MENIHKFYKALFLKAGFSEDEAEIASTDIISHNIGSQAYVLAANLSEEQLAARLTAVEALEPKASSKK